MHTLTSMVEKSTLGERAPHLRQFSKHATDNLRIVDSTRPALKNWRRASEDKER